nr:aminopeptidase N C-terminal domain-containing protein [Paracoccaceae bacterium]
LALICARDGAARLAAAQFETADNMTETMAALSLLVVHGEADAALAAFYARWRRDRLVVDKWFAVQASLAPPEAAVETVAALSRHPDFDWRNPNRFRALIGAFAAANPAGFSRSDGAGYSLVVDWLIKLDPVNPQTAARVAASFGAWSLLDAGRQALLRAQLRRLGATDGLSRDTGEIVGRLLGDDDGRSDP